MSSIDILGTQIPISFLVGENAVHALDQASLFNGAREMAELINSCTWPARYADAFRIMKEIVFFEGQITVNGWPIDRPCCDEDDAIFYWEANEFNRNTDADVRANTFFHDCWHVVQYRARSNSFARDEDERLEREVDAIREQIQVARILGCSEAEIAFLDRFHRDQQQIRTRLAEGVGTRMRHSPGDLRAQV